MGGGPPGADCLADGGQWLDASSRMTRPGWFAPFSGDPAPLLVPGARDQEGKVDLSYPTPASWPISPIGVYPSSRITSS